MVNFKENYCFLRFQTGSIVLQGGVEFFFGGGVQDAFSIESYKNYDFPGGSRPYPISGSAHALIFKSLKVFS